MSCRVGLVAASVVAIATGCEPSVGGPAAVPEAARARPQDSPQLAAVRTMAGLLEKADFEKLYNEWCHPDLQRQLTIERFVDHMRSHRGTAIVQLYRDVLLAADSGAPETVMVARPQERDGPDRYEFVLIETRKRRRANPFERRGPQWHLELGLNDGRWKLVDTD